MGAVAALAPTVFLPCPEIIHISEPLFLPAPKLYLFLHPRYLVQFDASAWRLRYIFFDKQLSSWQNTKMNMCFRELKVLRQSCAKVKSFIFRSFCSTNALRIDLFIKCHILVWHLCTVQIQFTIYTFFNSRSCRH